MQTFLHNVILHCKDGQVGKPEGKRPLGRPQRRWVDPVHGMATYRCDDTRDCVIQFCPPDGEHMCSKYVEAQNKVIIKFSASSWWILINKYSLWVLRIITAQIQPQKETARICVLLPSHTNFVLLKNILLLQCVYIVPFSYLNN